MLASAVANAESHPDYNGEDLVVSAALVGSGPTLKRWRARARGRVGRIKKRTCHITIRLATVEPEVATRRRPKAEAEAPPKRARRPKTEAAAPAAAAAETASPEAEAEARGRGAGGGKAEEAGASAPDEGARGREA